ncbi:MAG: hypothetical protein E6K33_07550 [Gammaproteobacteria bacterium]|nr:MAG: hypothetical protein E6K33_07550 [Gammaproteobacteria bacterium]
MRIERRWFVVMAILFLPLLVVGNAYGETKYRWDIVNLTLVGTTPNINAGGMASARAQDDSMITITGSGTFTVGDDDVSGGGTWKTIAPDGTTVTGMGNYLVTRLIRFEVAPGHQTSVLHDNIGDGTLADNRAGLAYLRIDYDDGSKGILAVSCHLSGNPPPQGPDAAPASIFEGITASKGFAGYWNRVAPVGSPGTANANRTVFHILSGD